jgi:fluoroquinolone transport system permease protein
VTRLGATFRLEVRSQWRQKFYLASALVVGFLAIIVAILPAPAAVIVPAILLTNMVVSTFAFVAGLLLLEKSERTLEAQIVTPLRAEEYLLAKLCSLSALATVENVGIVGLALAVGLIAHAAWGWLLVGCVVSAALYVLLGFLLVIRYDTVNDFMMPMFAVTAVLELPALVAVGMPEWGWLLALPTHGPMMMFQAAVIPAAETVETRSVWMMIYAVTYPLLWIAVSFWLGRRALRRFVTAGIGAV